MRLFFVLIFFVNFLVCGVVCGHVYDLLKPFRLKYAIIGLFILCSLALILSRTWGKALPLELNAFIARLGYCWMALMPYALVWSFLCLVLRIFKWQPVLETHRLYFFLGETFICLLILSLGSYLAYHPIIRHYQIQTPKHISLKAVHITDVHLGFMNTEGMFNRIVAKIEALEPDILLITGDFLENERSYAMLNDLGRALRKTNFPLGIWAVKGNHEYIAGIDQSAQYMASLGIKTLRDSSVVIDGKLLLIGREDRSVRRISGKNPQTLTALLDSTVENHTSVRDIIPEKLTILLTHQTPSHQEYENQNIDLVLSGHTHAGQLFPFNLVVKKFNEISYGLQKRGNAYFYVSSGAGIWGPPVRIGTYSEIVVFEIN